MNLQTNTKFKPSSKVDEIAQVRKTYDYSIFENNKANRTINRLHVEKLKKSFAEKYLITPIIVNESGVIIDGHHRYTAAVEMNLPVYYMVINGYNHQDMVRLNQNSKKWDTMAYVDSYAGMGYPEYVKLKKFMKDNSDFGIRSIMTIISVSANGSRGSSKWANIDGVSKNVFTSSEFDNGYFVFETEKESRVFCNQLRRLKPYYKKYNTQRFVRAVQIAGESKNWDFERFLSKLKNTAIDIVDKTNIPEMLDQIEDIFNYRSRTKVSLKYE